MQRPLSAAYIGRFFVGAILITLGSACSSDGNSANEPFSIRFAAVDGDNAVGCNTLVGNLGPSESYSLEVSDLRFYVSNVRFYNEEGEELDVELDSNEFQYIDGPEPVSLIDLTDTTSGSCAASAIAFAEGTSRTNSQIVGRRESGVIRMISFDVGVPQSTMKSVISEYSAEDAPSPLRELYWSWATGYRHFVMNFVVRPDRGEAGEGYLHIGSRDCGGNGAQALTDIEACRLLNTPSVLLDGFNPDTNEVTVDVRQMVKDTSFRAPIYETEPPFAVVGEGPGVSCHSAPAQQPDCEPIFRNFGLDPVSGISGTTANTVFSYR